MKELAVRIRIGVIFLAIYAFLFVMVLLNFDGAVFWNGLEFLVMNLAVTTALFCLFRFQADWPLYLLMYSVYFLVYVVKAIMQYVSGLNTAYSLISIKVTLTNEAYSKSLEVVSAGHLVIAAFIVTLSLLSGGRAAPGPTTRYMKAANVNRVRLILFLWVAVSSLIMYKYGVAVMGTESVSLPYKMSGIFFYSRTVLLPLLLLYFFEKHLTEGDRKGFNRTLGLFFVLAISEMLVRASKSPLFILILQLGFLYSLLLARGTKIGIKIKKRYFAALFLLALILWPLVEVYRTMVVSDAISATVVAEAADYTQGQNYVLFALERLFLRIQGFMQLSGLVANPDATATFSSVFEYGSISKYYTQAYLGLSQEGHASSPSLLGMLLLLWGNFWHVGLVFYLACVALAWWIAGRFPHFSMPVKAILGYEIFNSFVAGTVDSAFYSLLLVFGVAGALEILFVVGSLAKRASIAAGSQANAVRPQG